MTPLSDRLKAALAFDEQDFRELYEIECGPQGIMQLSYLIKGAIADSKRLAPLHEKLIKVVEAAEVGCSCSYAIHTDGSGFQTRKPLRDGCALHAALAELRETVGGE